MPGRRHRLNLGGVPRFLDSILRITGIADLLARPAADAPRPGGDTATDRASAR